MERPDLRLLGADELERLRRLELAKDDETGAALADLWLAKEHELSGGEAAELVTRLPLLYFEQKRAMLAERLGVRVGALDELRRQPGGTAKGTHGRAVAFAETKPWPDSVDGARLLDDLATVFSRHVILPAGAADALALYVAYAHVFDLFDVAPLLAVTSPTLRCGKTTLLDVVRELVPRPLSTSNISAAALFRTVEKHKPTLLVDEADSFLKDNEPPRNLLNSGHTRGGAFAIRCDGEDLEPAQFTTWCPKVLAAIGKLAPTLADRSVEVRLQRKKPTETTGRVDRRARAVLAGLR